MAVYVAGGDRLELLAVVDVRRDPAWIEATLAESMFPAAVGDDPNPGQRLGPAVEVRRPDEVGQPLRLSIWWLGAVFRLCRRDPVNAHRGHAHDLSETPMSGCRGVENMGCR